MKRILSLLTILTLTTSGASSVISCVSVTEARQKVNKIVNDITVTSINVPSDTNPDTSNTNTIKAIKDALIIADPALQKSDLDKITFQKTLLKAGVAIPVKTTITVGDIHSTITLYVTLLK